MPPKRKAKAVTGSTTNPRPSRDNSGNTAAISPILLSDDGDADNDNSLHDKPAALNSGDDDLDEFLPSKRPIKKARKAPAKSRGGGGGAGARGGGAVGGKAKKPHPATVEQHLMEMNAKSKEFMQKFREEVVGERERGWAVLGKMRGGLDKTAAVTTQKNALDATPVMVRKENNPLYKQTQEILRLSRRIVQRHRDLEKEAERPGLTTPREAWREDGKEMGRLLSYGRQYGEKLVAGLISPDGVDVVGTNGEGGEVDGMVAELFKNGKAKDTWGRVARDQVKALTGMVRTLAGHEGEE